MRNPLLTILLVLLALVPVAVWAYTAYGFAISYLAAEGGARKAGQAAAILLFILAALTPGFIGGILMIVGAALLRSKPLGARIMASIGLGIVAITVLLALASEAATAHYSMVIA